MIIKQFVLGQLENNVYLIADEKTKKAVLIDATSPSVEITQAVKELGVKIEYILLTHGHFDHIMGLNALKKNLIQKQLYTKMT